MIRISKVILSTLSLGWVSQVQLKDVVSPLSTILGTDILRLLRLDAGPGGEEGKVAFFWMMNQ